jgi:hypothetical protein
MFVASRPVMSEPCRNRDAMKYRILGRTGLRVSALGYGGSEIGYNAVAQATVNKIVGAALDSGINVFDSAECYADGEVSLGRALGKRRSDIILMTKCGHATIDVSDRAEGFAPSQWHPTMLARSIDRSLKRLDTDYIDVIQFHSPPDDVIDNPDAIEVLTRAREAGKARFIGLSLDSASAVRAVEMGVFDTLQISVSIADQEAIDLAIPKAAAGGMGVIAKRPIANAAWTSAAMPEDWYGRPYWERLRALKYDFMSEDIAAATAIRFTLAVPGVHTAIVGTTRPNRIVENVRAAALSKLPAADYEKIRTRWREVARPDWIGQR